MVERVIVGGTFETVHKGHEKLLKTALDKGQTVIGLVSDDMLEDWKPEIEKSFRKRKKGLEEYIEGSLQPDNDWEIKAIDDPYSMAVDGDFDVLVVSYDTRERGEEINRRRKEEGKPTLELSEVPPIMAEDLMPISSTRIREGDIDRRGKRLRPIRIRIGSENPVKIGPVEDVLSELFSVKLISEGVEIEKEGKEQPIDDEILNGAERRARVPDDFDLGIGIESGIVTSARYPFSVEIAAVKDRDGWITVGRGPGYPIPENWVEELKSTSTLSEKMGSFFESYDPEEGAVSVLSQGRIDRASCIKTALQTSLIPRINGSIYLSREPKGNL